MRAQRFKLIVTVCPSVYRRLSKLWQNLVFPDYIFGDMARNRIKEDLMFMVRNKMNLRDVQQLLFARHGLKFRIATLKRWIMQSYASNRSRNWQFVKWN